MPTRRNRHARPDAILFLPGFGDPWEGDMVEGLGERFEVALKRNTSAPLDFHREVSAKQFPHPFGTTKLVKLSVSARGNNQREELAHLYVLDLSAQLIDRYWAAGTQRKALEILFLIARLTPKVVKAFSRNRNLEAIITSIFGALVLIMMLVGLLILGATLLLGFGTLAQFDSTLLSGPVKWALLASAAVTGVLAARPQVRRFFVSFTTICLGLINYAAAGERKNVVVGSLASFLVHLTQDGSYKRIHVLAYSMGSLIALDALYPAEEPIRQFKNVDTLVTIGCPAEMVQIYWPDHFNDRHKVPGSSLQWINIFYPRDIFGSNFISGDADFEMPPSAHRGRAKRVVAGGRDWLGIQLRGQSGTPIHPCPNKRYAPSLAAGKIDFILDAMRAHQSYWDRTSAIAASVFDTLVQYLFQPSIADRAPRQSLRRPVQTQKPFQKESPRPIDTRGFGRRPPPTTEEEAVE